MYNFFVSASTLAWAIVLSIELVLNQSKFSLSYSVCNLGVTSVTKLGKFLSIRQFFSLGFF
jgi:hypothetical protein